MCIVVIAVTTTGISLAMPVYTGFLMSVGLALSVLLIFLTGQSTLISDDFRFRRRVPEARDPSLIQRVVIDAYTGKEVIVNGDDDDTFREACLKVHIT